MEKMTLIRPADMAEVGASNEPIDAHLRCLISLASRFATRQEGRDFLRSVPAQARQSGDDYCPAAITWRHQARAMSE